MAAKKKVQFRLDEETTLSQIDSLIPVYSDLLKVQMDRTKIIEYLVSERYSSYDQLGVLAKYSEVPKSGSET
jgi:hypothetical protein